MAGLASNKMSLLATLVVLCVFVVILMPGPTCARPPTLLSRHRRVSDQRLAEIETLLALEEMKGRVVTVPVAFGLLDPEKIGRRRRSATNERLETLKRILQVVSQNREVGAERNEKILPLTMKNQDYRRGYGGVSQLI